MYVDILTFEDVMLLQAKEVCDIIKHNYDVQNSINNESRCCESLDFVFN